MTRPLSPEAAVLLAAARVALDAPARERLASAGGLDWPRLVARSVAEGVAPLLHHHLGAVPGLATRVPRAAMQTLARATRETWARTLLLRDAWREAVLALEARGIATITLKGMVLAQTVYASPALRPMVDIDLLVPPDAVEAAIAVLADLGYRIPDDPRRDGQEYRGYVTLVRDGAVVDLRWYAAHYTRYTAAVRIDHAGLWERSVRQRLGDVEARVLGTEDLLLYLTLHLSIGSEFGRLIWFTDVDAVIRAAGALLDWDAVVRRARQWRLGAVQRFVLEVVQASLGTPVPAGVLPRLDRLPGRRPLVGWLLDGTCPPTLRTGQVDDRTSIAEALLMDRPVDIARLVGNAIVPPARWVALHYSVRGPRVMLYRVLHPLRVFGLALRQCLPSRGAALRR